jgi:hypothetical protein
MFRLLYLGALQPLCFAIASDSAAWPMTVAFLRKDLGS